MKWGNVTLSLVLLTVIGNTRVESQDLTLGDSVVATSHVTGSELRSNGNVFVNYDGPVSSSALCFFNGAPCSRSLSWDDSDERFEFNGALLTSGPIQAGVSVTDPEVGFHAMGGMDPQSGDITNDGDLFVSNDVEVGSDLYLNRDLYMEGSEATDADGNQEIWFYDNGVRQGNVIRWDDERTDSSCSGTSPVDSAFVWDIDDGSNSSWLFTNNADIEFKFDEDGDMAMDGSLVQSGSCDLAETFLGPELEPGTVVVLALDALESVVESTTSYDEMVVGVVSRDPGVLLNGPTSDYYEVEDGFAAVRKSFEENPEDPALAAKMLELESIRDGWQRGNLPIALAGRVPVKVDGTYGVIEVGDALTSSPTPGHAMVMDRPGPTIGVAMESFHGATGMILMLVKPGWYVPTTWTASWTGRQEASQMKAALQESNARIAELETRLAELAVALRNTTGQRSSVVAGLQTVERPPKDHSSSED